MENLEHRVAESRTEQIQIVMPGYTNGNGRLFGGKLRFDRARSRAALCRARRDNAFDGKAGSDMTTVSIDNLQFKKAAYANDTVLLIGQITHVGVTSMEVRVEAFVERLDGSKELVNRAYFTLVALDSHERPTPVPRLVPETDEERAEWEAGTRRTELRLQRRIEQF